MRKTFSQPLSLFGVCFWLFLPFLYNVFWKHSEHFTYPSFPGPLNLWPLLSMESCLALLNLSEPQRDGSWKHPYPHPILSWGLIIYIMILPYIVLRSGYYVSQNPPTANTAFWFQMMMNPLWVIKSSSLRMQYSIKICLFLISSYIYWLLQPLLKNN